MLKMYEAVLTPYDGGYEVEIPDLDIATSGVDIEDAARMAYDAMVNTAVAMLSAGKELPRASRGNPCPPGGVVLTLCAEIDPDEPEDPFMDVAEAASVLGVTTVRVCAMLRDGVLAGEKENGRWKVRAQSVRDRVNNPRKGGRPSKGGIAAPADALQA